MGLFRASKSHPDLAKLVADQVPVAVTRTLTSSHARFLCAWLRQVLDNALVAAGILDNPQSMLPRINKILGITMVRQCACDCEARGPHADLAQANAGHAQAK